MGRTWEQQFEEDDQLCLEDLLEAQQEELRLSEHTFKDYNTSLNRVQWLENKWEEIILEDPDDEDARCKKAEVAFFADSYYRTILTWDKKIAFDKNYDLWLAEKNRNKHGQ